MKKTLYMLLALCLVGACLLPAVSEEVRSTAAEAPVPEARTAGGDNGLFVDGDAALPWDEGDFGVSAASDADEVISVNPYGDESACEEAELELTELTAEELPAPVLAEPDGTPVLIEDLPEPVGWSAGEDLPDSDDLFAGYARRILYGSGKRLLRATGNAARALSGQNRVIYEALKAVILQVADGAQASTVVAIPIASVLGKTRFSASELGVTIEYDDKGNATAASLNAFSKAYTAQFVYSLDLVMDALWADCTYELYWFDRYATSYGHARSSYYRKYDADIGDYVIYLADDNARITVSLPVLQQYAGSAAYTVDTDKLQSAKDAAANARAIVAQYADCSDYVKLYGYVYEICRLVDYNHDLPTKTVNDQSTLDLTDQNPWKLIWVFDGDPDTKVVCEGYAMAFSYLCELSDFDTGVRCLLVGGTAGEAHAWNIVRMGGENYVVDVTWIDGTWVNNLTGGMADWISSEAGHSLFLAGGTGSVAGGYTVNYRTGSRTSWRTYSADTLATNVASDLALSSSAFEPDGFQRIHGATYYFENGAYIKNDERTIDDTLYEFDSDGVLAAATAASLHTAHTPVTDEAVAPTCTTPGFTEGSHCSVCGAVLVEQDVVPALGHWYTTTYTLSEDGKTMTARRTCLRDATHFEEETADTTIAVIEATCARKGVTSYTATFTDSDTKTLSRITSALPHTLVIDKAVAPTCTTTGLTQGSHCSVCEAVLLAQEEVPMLDHTPVTDEAVAPTCTKTGLTEGSHCSVCETVLMAQEEIPKLSHAPVTDEAVAPTCAKTGLTEGSHCAVCQAVIVAQETVKATGQHTPGAAVTENVVAATCTKNGSYDEVVYCSVCKAELSCTTKTLEKLAHTPGAAVKENVVAATCQGDGGYDEVVYCTVCKTELSRTARTIEKLAHTPGAAVAENAVAATCAKNGSYDEVVYCAACRAELSRTTKTTEKLAHAPGAAVTENAVAATCAKDGSYDEVVYCSVCKAELSRTAKTTEKLAHTPVTDGAVEPTYQQTGLTEGSHCKDCGAILVAQEVVPALTPTTAPTDEPTAAPTDDPAAPTDAPTGAPDAKPVRLDEARIAVKDQVYTGKALKPAVTVTLDGAKLVKGTDYKVAYANNIIGTATVTVTGIGEYEGTATATFRINLKKVSGLKLKEGAKQLAVSWKKVSGVTGYQVQYATKKTFKGAKTVTVKGAKTLKATLKKLKAKTAYYVRVRAYKTVKGVRYTSAWSAVKSKRTK